MASSHPFCRHRIYELIDYVTLAVHRHYLFVDCPSFFADVVIPIFLLAIFVAKIELNI